ncbi:MAG TPA: hypothetical protein VFV38_47735, partial [Ktedonobacteraceae bacterium]|nr:hypothetical protein [Ktedonobacteraceae bacterium]
MNQITGAGWTHSGTTQRRGMPSNADLCRIRAVAPCVSARLAPLFSALCHFGERGCRCRAGDLVLCGWTKSGRKS